MVKIFARLIKNHKTVKSYTYVSVKEYDGGNFYFHISEVCRKLDIETPIIIKYHQQCYEDFNFVKFLGDDFIDKQNFDYLLIENVDL